MKVLQRLRVCAKRVVPAVASPIERDTALTKTEMKFLQERVQEFDGVPSAMVFVVIFAVAFADLAAGVAAAVGATGIRQRERPEGGEGRWMLSNLRSENV